MNRRMISPAVVSVTLWIASLVPATQARADAIIADHYGVGQFGSIPSSVIVQVQTDYRIFYGHTSHGSQIMTGLYELEEEDAFYALPTFHEYGDDLGHNGDTSWVPPTRTWLDAHPDYNVAMWSWCGGCSDNTEEGINIYLNAMSGLEQDYPDVIFIYMTGHLNGGGPEGNLYVRNNQIRAYCADSGKILFDFADIESYDPDGNYYPYESDGCGWCYDWCASHTCPSCGCAHSHCFNCYLKGKGFWWMMASVSGWNPSQDSPFIRADANANSTIAMSDAVFTLRYIYVPGSPDPSCMDAADANDEGSITMEDAVFTLRYLYIPHSPSPPPPHPDCGVDPTTDGLGCGSHPCP